MLFDLPMFTLIHVVISVLGIIAGLVVVGGLMAGARLDGWTAGPRSSSRPRFSPA